jgi:hypothetical protein
MRRVIPRVLCIAAYWSPVGSCSFTIDGEAVVLGR